MGEANLLKRTRELLEEPLLGQEGVDAKVYRLLEGEYLRRLARYHRVDSALRQKYGMAFEDFAATRVTREKGYSWEVESDAMDWETAVGGMRMLERKLRELRESSDI